MPIFIEKLTPVSKEKCLVRYLCTYSPKISYIEEIPKITFKIRIPVITTYPGSAQKTWWTIAQLSIVAIEVESSKDIFPEDIVEIVDKQCDITYNIHTYNIHF